MCAWNKQSHLSDDVEKSFSQNSELSGESYSVTMEASKREQLIIVECWKQVKAVMSRVAQCEIGPKEQICF